MSYKDKMKALDVYILENNKKGSKNFYRELTLESLHTNLSDPLKLTGSISTCKKLSTITKMIKDSNTYRKIRIGSYIYDPDDPHILFVKTKDPDIKTVDCLENAERTKVEFLSKKAQYEARMAVLREDAKLKGPI